MKEFDRTELAELHLRVVASETAYARAFTRPQRDQAVMIALETRAQDASREFWEALYRIEIFPG